MSNDASRELRRALRSNGCCCCNAWCWANSLLTIGLVFQILAIIYDSYAVAAMYSPLGTFPVQCYEHDVWTECDLKVVLEDYGYTGGVAIVILLINIAAFLINLLAFCGLHNATPWMLLLLVGIGWVSIIVNFIHMMMARQYEYIVFLIIPLALVAFYTYIWREARYHRHKEAQSRRQRSENQRLNAV